MMVATSGEQIGQVNGLAVTRLGNFSFGMPARITATARPGRGQVVDIEREAKLGGPIHSKAVMILSRCIASRYAANSELSLSASLAFEQSYAGVEGDSASVAEVCVLLSALAGVPLKQSLAVTGSINQHGDVQAVGGVNEKVEGFSMSAARPADCRGMGSCCRPATSNI
jgi:predicted ATP-dependent protease